MSGESTSRGVSKKRSWKWRIVLLYLALLGISTLVRMGVPQEGELLPGQVRVTVPAYDRDIQMDETVQMAYRDCAARSGQADAPVLVIIHGSPVGSSALDRWIPELEKNFRVIVPDLPGFGGSTIDIPDYSTRAGAYYVLELLNKLGIKQAYFAGYSMGGGVILNIADIAPERVKGLIMASAIGVQEYELLGNYPLNHGLHGLQLGVLWALQNFTPHFGYMDHGIFNEAYARNFYDTDQRPFRGIIEAYAGPMLILHGKDDNFVPPGVAAEHTRIAQQPELHWFEGGHIKILTEPQPYTEAMRVFIDKIEAGGFVPQSIGPSTLPQSVKEPGYGLLSALLAVGTLISEDLSCIIGGLLASQGTMPLLAAMLACGAGIFIGDLMLYAAGLFLGKPALNRAPLKWMVAESTVERMGRWYEKRGAVIILISRFVPGTRLPAYVAAGMLHVPLRKFLPYFALAVILWTPVLVGLSYLAGDVVLQWVDKYDQYAIWILLGLVFSLWFLLHWLVPLLTWRGRRLLRGRWMRLTKWEYWPLWAVYIPVGCYIVWRGLKYRCPPLFTAVNPGIPNGGGLASESKSVILTGLKGAGDSIAAWALLRKVDSPEENWSEVEQFMTRHGLVFPIVLKPDIGERGQGVAIIRSKEAGLQYFENALGDTIAQAFAPGLEYGVFYYRYPGQSSGHILGVTDKRFPAVVGNGKQTLEALILNDPRAVAMARFYMRKFEGRLDEVIPAGERFALSELGTHCRGSEFLDASDLVTPELVTAMDEISRHFEGYYFGRYDIRVPSIEDFKAGRKLKVIELNGLTSEATFIYDPKYSYFDGLRILCRQWRICFKIAALNRELGYQPLSTRDVFRLHFENQDREKLEV